ncbi:hypothetical protein [Cytobacillus purgationiresistens]|uniref:Uncharacterized protein n=1 Tax=Cytobacillus purgationiresistens TaxID=863449 RepID=A0ABU0APV1_9BACI|nr:hypothetical protein [Cytobacillus purgationiresistens]MDQ0273316.1 hypothetical protein [Cytobacillus purgationiresistens]
MGQLTKSHRFFPYVDLHNKSTLLKNELDKIGSISHDMLSGIKKELEASSGRLIEETINSLLAQHHNQESTINSQTTLMDTMASRYHYQINDINTQPLTVYYEEADIPLKK